MDDGGTSPLHTRRRIWTTAATAAGVVALFALLRMCGPTAEQPGPATTFATAPATSATGSPPNPPPGSTTRGGSDADAGASPEQIALARTVAQRFATDFADPGTDRNDWLTRIAASSSPYLAAELATADWRRIGTAQVKQLITGSVGASVADFTVEYDTGRTLTVRVERFSDGWRVTTVLPGQRP